MTTYTITTDTNIDELTSKAGGDTYNVGANKTLTIDQDSRYGLNATTSAILGSVTASTTTGGSVLIDARYVRLIPFESGSGTAAAGEVVTCGSATGEVIAIYTSLTATPALTGASGWIKIKQWNGTSFPTSGDYTTPNGFAFTITGADSVGWIEVVGQDGQRINQAALGTIRVLGEWFELGTTNGSAGQTFQVPTNGSATWIPGVYIEETVGEEDWEFYPAVADATDIAADIRAKVCWAPSTGVVTIGHNGSVAAGYTPDSGRRVVIGNVIGQNSTSADRTINVLPNATPSSRFTLGNTVGGAQRSTFEIDAVSLAWRVYVQRANPVAISRTAVFEGGAVATSQNVTIDLLGVGLSADLNLDGFLLSSVRTSNITNSTFARSQAGSGNGAIGIVAGSDATMTTCVSIAVRNPSTSSSTGWHINGSPRCHLSGCTIVGGQVWLRAGSVDATILDLHYVDRISGTTGTTNAKSSVAVDAAVSGVTVDGIDFLGITNVHPYNSLVATGTCGSVRVRVGLVASPLDLGSTNACSCVISVTTGAVDTRGLERCYVTNARTELLTGLSDDFPVNVQNADNGYAKAATPCADNSLWRAVGCTGAISTSNSLFGTHFWDCYTSTTAGRLILLMHPPSTASAALVTFTPSATAYWDYAHGLHLHAVNDTCTWEQSYYMIGHTGFSGASVMAGGTIGNYLVEFQIDKNDGTGFSSWATASQANLEGHNATISAVLGFKLKVRLTTGTANTSAITSVYFGTTSTTTTQAYLYKKYETPIVVHAIDATTLAAIVGAAVYVEAGTGGEYTAGTEIGRGTTDSSGNCTIVVKHDAAQQVNGVARKSSATPFYSEGVLQATIAPGVTQTIVTALLRED
jgi:hypothetical protein